MKNEKVATFHIMPLENQQQKEKQAMMEMI